jgi:hypothetical protein
MKNFDLPGDKLAKRNSQLRNANLPGFALMFKSGKSRRN